MASELKYCPLTFGRQNPIACLTTKCAWWKENGDYSKCAVMETADYGYKLYKMQQSLEGGSGGYAGKGGGRKASGTPRQEYEPPDFDENEDPFGE